MMSTTTSKILSLLNSSNLTTENLRGVSTPSSKIAWISGANGTFLRTINQGETWEVAQIINAEGAEFRDVKAFDENTAYIMSAGHGDASRIYKTVDGGNSWQLQLQGSHAAEFFNCMAFWNKNRGMVLSDPVEGKFKVYSTENGGETWIASPKSGMPNALNGEGAFAASGSCMTTQGDLNAWFGTGGNTARVFHTSNGGNKWEVVNTPIMQDSNTAGIFSISFYDSKNGVVAGGDYIYPEKDGPNLAITNDGGFSWKVASISPQYYWSAVSYTPDHEGILLIGNKHAGLTKCESAQKWEKSWNFTNLNACSFWSNNKVLAVGAKGIVVEFETPKLI